MLAPGVFTALCLLPGLPVAALLARRRPGATPAALLALEGVLLGLVWYVLLGVALVHAGRFDRPTILAVTAVVALVAGAVLFFGPDRWWRGSLARPRVTPTAVVLAVVFVAAAALRTTPAYFLFQISDFGEYVNRGNVLADGGSFSQWFTNGFSVVLGLSHLALGEAHTVDIVGFLGLLVMALVLGTAARLDVPAWGLVTAAVGFAIGVVPTWYSNFPASETFYAALLAGLLLVLVTAIRHDDPWTAATAAPVALGLMLARGNAVLVILLLLGFAVAVAPFVGRAAMRSVVIVTGAGVAGLFAGFVYNSRYNHPYFIAFQMPQFFPDRVWRRFDDLGGLGAAAWKGAIFAAVVAAVLATAIGLRRWSARVGLDRRLRWALLPVALLVAVAALWWPLDAGGLREALETYEGGTQVLLVLGALGAGWVFTRTDDDARRAAVLFAAVFALAYALVHAYRFGAPRYAPYYLYWDRYLWSEFLPMMLLLAALAVGVVQRWWQRLARGRVPVAAALAVVAGVGVVTTWSAGALAREQRFLGDAYGQLAEIDDLLGDEPIVFSGRPPEEVVESPIHYPNTYRLFAQPLRETFGRTFLNVVPSYEADDRPTVAEATAMLATAGHERGLWLEVLAPGEAPAPGVALRGIVDVEIPMLDSPRWERPEGWRTVRWRVAVGELVGAGPGPAFSSPLSHQRWDNGDEKHGGVSP